MIPSMASVSQSSAAVRVDKATSDFLIGPDWALNMDICDMINSNNMLAKDVVKAVKKRLQHKNPRVQFLALTLLEMMVKNCGDYVHFQIAERDILPEMVKIVRKKGYQTDFQVTDKILTLIGAWSDALGGGSNGKYPQYRMAYEELRRSGIQFPQRSADSALIFTPPVVHPAPRYPPPGHGMPSSSTTRLDQAMAAEANISLFTITTMREVHDLLADMLTAVDARDRSSIKDEVIVDLVEQCRVNQRKLMQYLETTGDEELLRQGLDLNDHLQNVLAKHDAIASGTLPPEMATKTSKPLEKHDAPPPAQVNPPSEALENPSNSLSIVPVDVHHTDDEEEDEFAKLARRHSTTSGGACTEKNEATSSGISSALVPVSSEAVQSKDQDIMDLLSLTLTTPATTSSSDQTPQAPPPSSSTHDSNHFPTPDMRFSSEATPGHPGFAFNSYVAPWAQPQIQTPPPPQFWQPYTPFQPQNFSIPQVPSQPQFPVQVEQKPQHEFPTSSPTSYPPPPWASIPSNYSGSQTSVSGQQATGATPSSAVGQPNSSPRSQNGQKPFIPSYKLFDDLDVFSTTGGRFKPTTNSILGSSNNMVGGRK